MIDKNAGVEREVTGYKPGGDFRNALEDGRNKDIRKEWIEKAKNSPITAPSTPLAKKYSGYKYSIAPLKQTNETIMVFQKPTKTGSPLHDVLAMENGDNTITASCLDIDGNRVGTEQVASGGGMLGENGMYGKMKRDNDTAGTTTGRYPSQTFCNELAGQALDRQSGVKIGSVGKRNPNGRIGGVNKSKEIYGDWGAQPDKVSGFADTGGCSKILHKCDFEKEEHDLYIYCPKVSKSERNKGCEGMEDKLFGQSGGAQKAISDGKTEYQTINVSTGLNTIKRVKNNHPTLKPIKLITQILKLFKTPNEQIVLDTFIGSGTLAVVCRRLNYNYIGFEINPEYVNITKKKLAQKTMFDVMQSLAEYPLPQILRI